MKKVFALTTDDGGDNEIFAGIVSDLKNIKNPQYYTIYEVGVDSPFNTVIADNVPSQSFKEIISKK